MIYVAHIDLKWPKNKDMTEMLVPRRDACGDCSGCDRDLRLNQTRRAVGLAASRVSGPCFLLLQRQVIFTQRGTIGLRLRFQVIGRESSTRTTVSDRMLHCKHGLSPDYTRFRLWPRLTPLRRCWPRSRCLHRVSPAVDLGLKGGDLKGRNYTNVWLIGSLRTQ